MTSDTSKGVARRRCALSTSVIPVLVSAGIFLSALSASAQTQPKWQGSFDALGRAGSENGGQLDLFAPLYQNSNTLLFGNAIGGLDSDSSSGANFGAGIRHIFDNSFILGTYGYFDWLHSPNANTFYQLSGGVEAMTTDWDLRLNGYLPISNSQDILNTPAIQGTNGTLGDPVVAIMDNEIGLLRESVGGTLGQDGVLIQERPLGGVEGEVGYRLPFGNGLGSNTETRVFLGGYAFWGQGYPTYAGPRGRVEFRIFDLPFLGEGSRLTAGGEVSWDDPRGVEGEGSLRLRIPLNIFSGGSHPQLSDIDRRMVDPVPIRVLPIYAERTQVTPAAAGNVPASTFEAVNDTETGREIESIYFASGSGTSTNTGKQGDATDLTDAINRAGTNGLVVATGSGGNYNGHFVLDTGEILLGGASSLQVTGVTSNATLTYTPGLTRPTIVQDGSVGFGAVNAINNGNIKIQGIDVTGGNKQANPALVSTIGVLLQDSSNDIVRDVKVTGGDAGFLVASKTGVAQGDLLNNISATGSTLGLFMSGGGSGTNIVSGLKVDGATFDSLAGAGGAAGSAVRSSVSGSNIANVELDNIAVTNTLIGGFFLHIDGLTINGWNAIGKDTSSNDNNGIVVQHGSGFDLSNFSISNYRQGIGILDNGTGNTIDGTTKGIIKDIGTASPTGTSGISITTSTVSVNSISISGVGQTSVDPDFDILIGGPATVKISNVTFDGNNSGSTQVTDAAILLGGTLPAHLITVQSGSTGNTAVNMPQVCRNTQSGGASTTGAISFTNPAAATCP